MKSLPLFFYSIGDWGGFTRTQLYNMKLIAHQLNKSVTENKRFPQFVVTLGDNFYNKGVTSLYDPQWNSSWHDIFIKPYPNMDNIEWMALLGNHDYNSGMRGVTAQINQTWNKNNTWHMPNNNYYYTYEELGAHFIHLDTCEIYPELYPETQSIIHQSAVKKTLNFAETCLRAAHKSNARWIFVFGHYHIYSNGYYGNYDIMEKRLGHLLQKYKVDAYFSGHEHNFQHFQHNGVKYVINGAATMNCSNIKLMNKKKHVDTIFITKAHGFCEHMLSKRRFITRYVNSYGDIEHEFQIIKR